MSGKIRKIAALNQQELNAGIDIGGSWHNDYNDTAYIYIGGLPPNLTEGDIVTIFSQYGNPVHVKLVRDKETGKSKCFAFLKYEDQRSTVLAVDNFNGVELFGKTLSVDHTYYTPKDGEMEWRREQQELLDQYGEISRKNETSSSSVDNSNKSTTKHELEETFEDPMKAYFEDRSKKTKKSKHK